MWPPYYTVATSSSPAGPFNDVRPRVTTPGFGRHGDFSLFVDNDGAAYHVRTGLEIVRLDGSYTAPLELVASIKAPGVEAPIMFKRQLAYYVVAGSDCCACTGGASLLVWGACDRDCGPMAAPRRHWHTHWGTRRPTQSTPLRDQCPGECCLHSGRPAAVAWKSVEHGAASVGRPALLGAAAVRNRSGRERKRSHSASSEI